MNERQWITLRDVFRQEGLTERQIEDVFLLLSFKPERVQLAFYYVGIGFSYDQAGEKLGVSHTTVIRRIRNQCDDISSYLRAIEYVH
jgi:DNA-directed RNA polymerase specialized sigma24 family protein